MLVPVSPSGTGKTFNPLTLSTFLRRLSAPAKTMAVKSFPFIEIKRLLKVIPLPGYRAFIWLHERLEQKCSHRPHEALQLHSKYI